MGDSVELMVGRIEGRMDGIGKEIVEIKEILKCQSKDCKDCRAEIDERDSAMDVRINGVEAKHTGEQAVRGWLDNNLVRIGVLIGAVCGALALIQEYWPHG